MLLFIGQINMKNKELKKILENKIFQKRIWGVVNKKYYGNEYLFEYLNIFDKKDLYQDLLLNIIKNDNYINIDYLIYDSFTYIKELIRKAKRRKEIANINTFTGYNIIDSEYIEKYIYYKKGKKIG